jgi:hypothetical protein
LGPLLTPAGAIILPRYVLPLYQFIIPVKFGGITLVVVESVNISVRTVEDVTVQVPIEEGKILDDILYVAGFILKNELPVNPSCIFPDRTNADPPAGPAGPVTPSPVGPVGPIAPVNPVIPVVEDPVNPVNPCPVGPLTPVGPVATL